MEQVIIKLHLRYKALEIKEIQLDQRQLTLEQKLQDFVTSAEIHLHCLIFDFVVNVVSKGYIAEHFVIRSRDFLQVRDKVTFTSIRI